MSGPAVTSAPDLGADWKSGYEQTASEAKRARLTTETVRAERLAALRANDPVLDAAVDLLDLELLD